MSGRRSKIIACQLDGRTHPRLTPAARTWFAGLRLTGTRRQRSRQAKQAWLQRRDSQPARPIVPGGA